ncbi:hypothetical protein DFH09DRAFT_1309761 [Mycena vulgaris]|nr:hypothetical protein DFH09DRAFT_1309761 [Mycena vulgaris]
MSVPASLVPRGLLTVDPAPAPDANALPSRGHATEVLEPQAECAVSDEVAQWRAQREEAAARDAPVASSSSYRYNSPPASSSTSYGRPQSTASGVSMPIPVTLASNGAHPGAPQTSDRPPTFVRTPSSSGASSSYPMNPSGTGPRYPSSAGVSFGDAYANAPSSSSQYGGASTSSDVPTASSATPPTWHRATPLQRT